MGGPASNVSQGSVPGRVVIGKYRHYLYRKNFTSRKGRAESPESSLKKCGAT